MEALQASLTFVPSAHMTHTPHPSDNQAPDEYVRVRWGKTWRAQGRTRQVKKEEKATNWLDLVFQGCIRSEHKPDRPAARYRRGIAGQQSVEPAWKSSRSALSAPGPSSDAGIRLSVSPVGSSCSSSQWSQSPPTPPGWGRCRRGRLPQGRLCSLHLL